jgi:hypothetical protein
VRGCKSTMTTYHKNEKKNAHHPTVQWVCYRICRFFNPSIVEDFDQSDLEEGEKQLSFSVPPVKVISHPLFFRESG